MNALLCHVRHALYEITQSLISGAGSIPYVHMETCRSLAADDVPRAWTHQSFQPSTHSLFSWLDGKLMSYVFPHTIDSGLMSSLTLNHRYHTTLQPDEGLDQAGLGSTAEELWKI